MKKILKNILFLCTLLISTCGTVVICHAENNLTPVEGTDVKDGTYPIEVTSSSSMFRIVNAELKVEDGNMTAVLTLSGTGYLKLFMGTGEEALEAGEDDFIPYVEDDEGAYTYTVPVAVLNQEIDCAAYSKRKETWYDRKLVFLASALPEDALLIELPDVSENTEEKSADAEEAEELPTAKIENPDLLPVDLSVADGDYTMEVTLTGGSGKATVISPANIKVSDAGTIASIEWSSSNYDYMFVNGQQYLPVNTDGNSVFEIPVLALDQEMNVIGDTVAMSKPHEIEYTLTFHSDTLKRVSDSSISGFVIAVIMIPVILIFIAIIFAVNRKKKKHD